MEYIYGALLLHRLGQPVTESSLTNVLKAAGAQVDEAKVKTLLAALHGVDIAAEIANASLVSAPAQASVQKAEPAEEEKPSESAAGLASLFG